MTKQYEIDRILKRELDGATDVALFYHSKAGAAKHHRAQRQQLLGAADAKNIALLIWGEFARCSIASHSTFSSETNLAPLKRRQDRAACPDSGPGLSPTPEIDLRRLSGLL